MATRACLTTYPAPRMVQATWAGLLQSSTDVGGAASIARWPDRTVTAYGTFGAGGAAALEGSEDGVTWGALTDPNGTAISLATATPMAVIGPNPTYIRPKVTAGDGTTALTVVVTGVG